MKDYHVHSNFSDDCFNQPMLTACQQALAKGIDEIAFTEHVDIDYPEKDSFQLDYEAYSKEIEEARLLFPNLKILKGLELGVQSHIPQKMHDYLKDKHFDFILGSVHTADGLELYGGDFTNNKTQYEAYLRYFEVLHACVKSFESFNILSHFDLIRRYGNYENTMVAYAPYMDVIDDIFKLIIPKGIGIEINTSGWRYGINDFLPGREILKRYQKLGGEIITFGSDAHRPEHLGYKFAEAYELAKGVGFKYFAYYRAGKPKFAKIP